MSTLGRSAFFSVAFQQNLIQRCTCFYVNLLQFPESGASNWTSGFGVYRLRKCNDMRFQLERSEPVSARSLPPRFSGAPGYLERRFLYMFRSGNLFQVRISAAPKFVSVFRFLLIRTSLSDRVRQERTFLIRPSFYVGIIGGIKMVISGLGTDWDYSYLGVNSGK